MPREWVCPTLNFLRNDIVNKNQLIEEINTLVEAQGMEVVEVNTKKRNDPSIEIIIFKKSGVSLDDCQNISKEVEANIDLDSYFQGPYKIEVGSQGLDRKLTSLDDYRRHLGLDVQFNTYVGIEGKKEFVGKLVDYNEDAIFIEIDDKVIEIDRSIISLMRRHIEF